MYLGRHADPVPRGGDAMTQTQALVRALYPLGIPAHLVNQIDDLLHPHLSDEDICADLDKSARHSRRAKKSADTRKKKEVQHA